MGATRILGAGAVACFVALGGVLPQATAVADEQPAIVLAASSPTGTLLGELRNGRERRRGYDRSKFADWIDADGDGCDTRDEVLIAEAIRIPRIEPPDCKLSRGRWLSVYDGVVTVDPGTFDIDHLVALAEAWDSGARDWTESTRDRFANDLGYRPSLIAVTASSNRSKGDQEPREWMPSRPRHRCTYLARWVAVKWRWRLRVDRAERAFLAERLAACGWPEVATPTRAVVRRR